MTFGKAYVKNKLKKCLVFGLYLVRITVEIREQLPGRHKY